MAKSTKKQAASETAIEAPATPESPTVKDRKQPSKADNYGWEPVEVTSKRRGRPRKTEAPPEQKPAPAPVAEKKPRAKTPAPAPAPEPSEPVELVVFAFRLAQSEREEIHNAVAPSKASRFVRAVALAAARHDMAGIQTAIIENQRTAAA